MVRAGVVHGVAKLPECLGSRLVSDVLTTQATPANITYPLITLRAIESIQGWIGELEMNHPDNPVSA